MDFISIYGEKYPVSFDLSHFVDIEQKTGKPWEEVFDNLNLNYSCVILHTALVHGHYDYYRNWNFNWSIEDLVDYYSVFRLSLNEHLLIVARQLCQNDVKPYFYLNN